MVVRLGKVAWAGRAGWPICPYGAPVDKLVSDYYLRFMTRTGYKELWTLVERLTGLPYERILTFFAMGMLMNVAAAMDLPAVDERWARWCSE